MKQVAPAAGRNKEPIREVLARVLPPSGTVVTIAEGTGEHSVHFARAFPQLVWQPTDRDGDALASIAAYHSDEKLPNLRAPVRLDVTERPWPIGTVDAILCINMVHIAPWEAVLALFAGAGDALAAGAPLLLYGPYKFDGVTAPSNEEFDQSLRARDPRWGVREVRELEAAAKPWFALRETFTMPANNHSLLFQRV